MIFLLHFARALYLLLGTGAELFVAAQLVRCSRVYQLIACVQAASSDLAADVRLVAVGKFVLVLFMTPHWLACLWIYASDGWHMLAARPVTLPAWPAQFLQNTRNPAFDPDHLNFAEQCARTLRSSRLLCLFFPCCHFRSKACRSLQALPLA